MSFKELLRVVERRRPADTGSETGDSILDSLMDVGGSLVEPPLKALEAVGDYFTRPQVATSEAYGAYEEGGDVGDIAGAAWKGFTGGYKRAKHRLWEERLVPHEEDESFGRKALRMAAGAATDPLIFAGGPIFKAAGKTATIAARGAKSLITKAPVIGPKLQSAATALKEHQGLARAFRSVESLPAKFGGRGGKILSGRMSRALENTELQTGRAWLADEQMAKSLGLAGDEARLQRVTKVMENRSLRGKDKAVDDFADYLESRYVEDGNMLEHYADRYGEGFKVWDDQIEELVPFEMLRKADGTLRNYVPHTLRADVELLQGTTPKKIKKLAKEFGISEEKARKLIRENKVEAPRAGHIEMARHGDIPENMREMNALVLRQKYVGQVYKRVFMSDEFGVDYRGLDQLLEWAGGRVGDAEEALKGTRAVPFFHGTQEAEKVLAEGLKPLTKTRPSGDLRGHLENAVYLTTDEGVAGAYSRGGEVLGVVPEAGTRILKEGSEAFEKLRAAAPQVDVVKRSAAIVRAAKQRGYDAVQFKDQAQLGTVVMNPKKFKPQRGRTAPRQERLQRSGLGKLSDDIQTDVLKIAKGVPTRSMLGADDLINKVLGFQVLSKLGPTTTIMNFGQKLNDLVRDGIAPFAKGLRRSVSSEEKMLYATSYVSAIRNHLEQIAGATGGRGRMERLAGGWLRGVGFTGTEEINRVGASISGVERAKVLAQKVVAESRTGTLWDDLSVLPELKTRGITRRDIGDFVRTGDFARGRKQAIGLRASKVTQHATSIWEMPPVWQSPEMRVFLQFKRFAYNQARFLHREVAQPAWKWMDTGGKQGDIGPMLRAMVAYTGGGMTIATAREALRDMQTWALGAKKRKSYRDYDEHPIGQMLKDMSYVGSFGMAGDVFEMLGRGQGEGWILGPTVSDAVDFSERVVKTAKAGMMEGEAPTLEDLMIGVYRYAGRGALGVTPTQISSVGSRGLPRAARKSFKELVEMVNR